MEVSVDDPMSALGARLRHSWLENQVLLVLKPNQSGRFVREKLLQLLDAWRVDVARLLEFCRSFPASHSPASFLEAFAGRRGRTIEPNELSRLDAAFAEHFERRLGCTPRGRRQDLLNSAAELHRAVESFRATVAQLEAGALVRVDSVAAAEAYLAAGRIHQLMDHLPRGVWVP